eukprot:scaffold66852_cov22-Prasinocladus_malaysianus.AAC.1
MRGAPIWVEFFAKHSQVRRHRLQTSKCTKQHATLCQRDTCAAMTFRWDVYGLFRLGDAEVHRQTLTIQRTLNRKHTSCLGMGIGENGIQRSMQALSPYLNEYIYIRSINTRDTKVKSMHVIGPTKRFSLHNYGTCRPSFASSAQIFGPITLSCSSRRTGHTGTSRTQHSLAEWLNQAMTAMTNNCNAHNQLKGYCNFRHGVV